LETEFDSAVVFDRTVQSLYMSNINQWGETDCSSLTTRENKSAANSEGLLNKEIE
jgi:hypothetical protein